MAKGMAQFNCRVHGVDIVPVDTELEQRMERALGASDMCPPVKMRQVEIGKPLPYRSRSFDAVYAWSVFEHVAHVPEALSEIKRVLRPGGAFLLQIAPLYFSPEGG